jgi:hypothetical protein
MIECLHRPRYKLAWISHNFPTHKHVFLEQSPNPHWLMYHCRIHSNVSIYIVVLLWKCQKLTVMQQALLSYYGNATNSLLCNRHCYVTMETPNMSKYIYIYILYHIYSAYESINVTGTPSVVHISLKTCDGRQNNSEATHLLFEARWFT